MGHSPYIRHRKPFSDPPADRNSAYGMYRLGGQVNFCGLFNQSLPSAGPNSITMGVFYRLKGQTESFGRSLDLPQIQMGPCSTMNLTDLIPVAKVGGGSITELLEVQHGDSGRRFALKIPRAGSSHPKHLAKQFLTREAAALSKIRRFRCPFLPILAATGTFEKSGIDGFENAGHVVLEWIEGKSLRSILDQNGPLEIADAIGLCRQISQGLACLHQAELAHGDIHPDNILRGLDGIDRLIDLGCAHSPNDTMPECEGLLIGSADYWSPEACLSHGFAGPEADVFALGVVLWECLTGFRPWPTAEDLRETIRRRHGDPPMPLPEMIIKAQPGLARLLERMLSRHIGKRPKSRMVVAELMRLEISSMSRMAA